MIHSITNAPSSRGLFFELFAIDIRTLAVFRIGLGATLLFCLIQLIPHARMFLSDDGMFPVDLSRDLLNHASDRGYWSLYWMGTSDAVFQILTSIQVIAAISLLIGWKTRRMTVLCLILTWSLETRNPLLSDCGHSLLRMLLFWSFFLPLGSIWSVDSAWPKARKRKSRRKKTTWQVANSATLAIMIQVLIGYVLIAVSIILKRISFDDWFLVELKTRPMGRWFASHAGWVSWTEWFCCWLFLIVAITIFIPRLTEFFRGLWMALFLIGHVLLFFLLDVGTYPLVAIVSWLVFIPSQFWNDLLGRPQEFDLESSGSRRKANLWGFHQRLICGLLLVVAILASLVQWRLLNFGVSRNEKLLFVSQVMMLAPNANLINEIKSIRDDRVVSPRFQYVGLYADGKMIDLFTEKEVTTIAARRNSRQQTEPWKKFHYSLWLWKPRSVTTDRIALHMLQYEIANWETRQIGTENKLQSAQLNCLESVYLNGKFDEAQLNTLAEQ